MTTQDIEALRRKAVWAAFAFSAALALLALLTAAQSTERWSAQSDYDYAYANAGYGPFVGYVVAAIWFAALGVLLRRRHAMAGGAAFVSGWGMRVTLALLLVRFAWAVLSAFGIVYVPITAAAFALVFILQRPLMRYARAATTERWDDRATWTGVAAPIAYAFLCLVILRLAFGLHASFDRNDAVRSLWQLHRCAYRYLERHPDLGFPRGVTDMRSDSICSGRRIMSNGTFSLEYHAGPRDAAGRVTSFVTSAAQGHLPLQRYESLVADESGLVRVAVRRSATLGDHVTSASPWIVPKLYSGCLDMFRHSYGGYPANIAILPKRRCANTEGLVARNTIERHGYRLLYEPVNVFASTPDTLARGYRMDVRPIEYGVTGVRSYFVDERNILHATAFDRNASARDPEVRECEFDPTTPWRDCS